MSKHQTILIAAAILISGGLIALTIGLAAGGNASDSWVPGSVGILAGLWFGVRAFKELR